MEVFASPVLLLVALALFIWAWAAVGDFGAILDQTYNMSNSTNDGVNQEVI